MKTLNQEYIIKSQIEKAAHWLVESGVQVESDNPLHSGGFACWYDGETETMPYVYSEITGYLTTMMCALYTDTDDSRFLTSAQGSGNWLVRTAHEQTGGFRCLYPIENTRFDYKRNQIYVFDSGVILSGLVNVYRETGKAHYLAAAITVADWLINDMQKPDGRVLPGA